MDRNQNNMPYQADFYSAPVQVTEEAVASYLARVMGWMSVGLLTTFTVTLLMLSSPAAMRFIYQNNWAVFGVMVAQIVLVMSMSTGLERASAASTTVKFLAYSAVTGLTMGVISTQFETLSLLSVFALTALIFLTMSVYGMATKKDLTHIGSLAFFGLVGIILASFINLFVLRSSSFDLLITVVGIVIFIALVAYDTQKIKSFYVQAAAQGLHDYSEPVKKMAIFGALALYLDFINLFLKLLRLMGRRRN